MEEKRVATEISGLDEVLHGRASFLAGAAGIGKTILSLPWLLKVAPGRDAGGAGSPCGGGRARARLQPGRVRVWSLSGIKEEVPAWYTIHRAGEEAQLQRVVVSITYLRFLSSDACPFRTVW